MKLKAIIIGLILFVSGLVPAYATQLPQEVKNYLIKQKKIPSIRHDGLVIYSNDVMYLPVFPAYPQKVEELKVVKTYPENQSLMSMPDYILFNNNFSLLKIVKTGENSKTVKDVPSFPVEIKTGEIPQDLMVPTGLVLPESLAGILGDVRIPLIGSAKSNKFVTGRKAPIPAGKAVANTKLSAIPEKLRDKLFFVNNYQTEYLKVFSSTVSEPLYSLKTSGVMKDVKPALNGKYLLAATKGMKNVDVIDTEGEFITKHIDLTANPSEIIVDDANHKAYVSSVEDESLIIIDTNTLRMTEKIQLAGAPKKISLSPDGNKIAYMDLKTSNIFVLELNNNYANKLIANYPNTSKILLDNEALYLIARTEPKLRVVTFNLLMDNKVEKTKKDKKRDKIVEKEIKEETNEHSTTDIISGLDVPEQDEITGLKMYATSIKDIKTGPKPMDLYKSGSNIYVLCAGDNTVYKYDMLNGEVTSTNLPVEGFSKAFTAIPNSNLAVITNMADLKYVIYNMEDGKAIQTVPINERINSITILDRKDGQ